MNAANPKVQEPSMEEILASIRRIIADDQNAKTQQEAVAQEEPPAHDSTPDEAADDILDLAQVDEFTAGHATHDLDDIDFRDPVRTPETAAAVDEPMIAEPHQDPIKAPAPERVIAAASAALRPLLAPDTDAAVSAAFGSLATTVITSNARTLEDLVQDMLRPMLKTWLDDNLPSIVERLVRAEIERVARGSRG